MRTFLIAAVAALLSAPAFAQDAPKTLRLRCEGIATVSTSQVASSNYMGSGGGMVFGNTTVTGKRSGEAIVNVEITDGAGRARFSPILIPALNTGSKDGWWTLTNLAMGEDEILAKTKFNILNNVSLRIDRRNGDMEVKGLGLSFTGKCAPDLAERMF